MAVTLRRLSSKASLLTYFVTFFYMFLSYVFCDNDNKDRNHYFHTVSLGEKVLLDCNYTSEKERLWLYNNNINLFRIMLPIFEPFGNSVKLLGNYSLSITNLSLENEGLYQCVQESEILVNHFLSVEVLPEEVNVSITYMSDKTIIPMNRVVEVTCLAKGSKPAVNLTWLLNNDEVDSAAKQAHHISVNEDNNKTFDTVTILTFQPQSSPLKITCVVHGFGRETRYHIEYEADYATDPFEGTFNRGENTSMEDDIVLSGKLPGGGIMEYWKAKTSSHSTGSMIILRKGLSANATSDDRSLFRDMAIRLMAIPKHRNIVETIKITTKVPYYIYQEYINNGSLKDFLSKNLKPRVLYDNDTTVKSKEVAKTLANFVMDIVDAMTFLSKEKSNPAVAWLAPETSSSLQYSEKSDVWSFATLLWEMYSFGDIPYEDMTSGEIGLDIRRSMYLNQPDFCPRNLYDIMLTSWKMVPEERPSFASIRKILNFTKVIKITIFCSLQEFMDENPKVYETSAYFVLTDDVQKDNIYD
ncbi:Proto-oncogene tyrosine-protein kinase LCK [Holothuria leucospilota]|uniref:Proto-oncogene tyrosine-protein kinase LCK n=1 Tax=Holothuria leucospilota TaxID=206669 RepID=A0A9Q1CQZ4_HOLLE|nr:Proto-oncogene tyrosine-protein kinase LCK [Holothuria leucospilota]